MTSSTEEGTTPPAPDDPEAKPRSRRALLAGAAAGAVGLVAASLPGAKPVRAATGGNFILGQANAATNPTVLSVSGIDNIQAALAVSTTQGRAIDAETTDANAGAAIQARGPGGGVTGGATASGYPGVAGQGLPGVLGYGGAGVAGYGGGTNPPSTPPEGVGVYGNGLTAGVQAVGETHGVDASSPNGIGALAHTQAGMLGAYGFAGEGSPPTAQPETYSLPTGVYGEAAGANPTGIWGQGGVAASGSSTGVYGEGNIGVWGFGGWGVFGANDGSGTGVYGFAGSSVPAAPANTGVFGFSDTGYGVYARAFTGTALYVNGKARFSRSGRTSVAAGAKTKKVTMAGVTTASYIIATPQTNRAGVFVQSVVPAAGYFTINLNKTVAGTTYIGYLVIN